MMTVNELIKKLQEYDEYTEVKINDVGIDTIQEYTEPSGYGYISLEG